MKLQKVISNQTFVISRCLVNNCDLVNVYEDIMDMNSEINSNDSDTQMTLTDLDDWVGEYKFFESASEPNCQTAHYGRRKPHVDFGTSASPTAQSRG